MWSRISPYAITMAGQHKHHWICIVLQALSVVSQPSSITYSLGDLNEMVEVFKNFWRDKYYQESNGVPYLRVITTNTSGWISTFTPHNPISVHHEDRIGDTHKPMSVQQFIVGEEDRHGKSSSHFKSSTPINTKIKKRFAPESNRHESHQFEKPVISKNGRKPENCTSSHQTCGGICTGLRRSFCSCDPSCTVYSNCCDDYGTCQDLDHISFDKMKEHANSTIICMGNSLLVSSCSNDFDDVMWGSIIMSAKEMDIWWSEYLNYNKSSYSIEYRCESDVSNEFLQIVPVSYLGIHYRNIFCALCNNAPLAEKWDGFLKCQDFDVEKVSEGLDPFFMYFNSTDYTRESQSCQIFWWPRDGLPNVCYEDNRQTQIVFTDKEPALFRDTLQSPNTTRNISVWSTASRVSAIFYMNDGSFRDSTNRTFNVSKSTGSMPRILHSLQISRNFTALNEKCMNLRALLCNPFWVGQLYKNHFCYRMWDTDGRPPDNFNHLTTLQNSDNSKRTKLNESETHYSDLQDLFGSSEVLEMTQSLPFYSSVCNSSGEIHVVDKCLKISFSLTVVRKFTFTVSRRYKGSYQDQVESFAKITEEAMRNSTTNTSCITVNSETKKHVNNNQWLSKILFNCVELFLQQDAMESLWDSNVQCHSADYKHSINFVMDRENAISQTPNAITFPIDMESTICIFKETKKPCCHKTEMSWKAVRVINPVIGSVTMEGLITIICCSLSNVGLLCRLALQNTVPFYKSYPGKVQFSLCLSLLFSYTLFLIGGMVKDGSMECVVVSVLTHLAFLSALFWMNVTAFEIWRTFRHWSSQVVSRGNTSLMLSTLYALGIPIAIVGCALLVEVFIPESAFCPAYGIENCWLNGSISVAVFFVVPCSMICCANVIFVGLTLRGLRRQRTSISEFKQSNAMTAVTDTTIVLKIVALVGITWLLGLLAAVVDQPAVWIIFTVINASLGFVISAVLVLNKRVFLAVQAQCLCYNPDSFTTTQIIKH